MTKNTQAENFVHCWICWIIYISVFSWTVVLIVMSLSFVCMSLLTDRTMSTRCGTVTARGSCSGCGWRAWVHCHRPRPSHHAPLHFPFSLRSFTSCRSRASQVHQFHLITWYTNSGDTRSRNWYKSFRTRKLHVCPSIWYKFFARNWAQLYTGTENVWLWRVTQKTWLARELLSCKKLRLPCVKFSMKVSGTSFLSVCHQHYSTHVYLKRSPRS